MSKFSDALTDAKIRNSKPSARPYRVFDGKGLYLLVHPRGAKYWRFKYRFAGRERLIGFGVYPEIGLRRAREKRNEARRQIDAGGDPSEQRKAAKSHPRAGITFETVAREWLEKFSPSWVPTHTVTVEQRLETNVFPWLGSRPIDQITAPMLLELLRRIEARGAISVAHRTKGIAGQIFRYAIATGRASRDPSADLRGALASQREGHFGAVTKPSELAGLLRAIDAYEGSFIVKSALKFSALTFARPGEIRKAEWHEIDPDHSLWRIPAERMKMRREHLVPLSRQAIHVLEELRPLTGRSRYIFPCARGDSRPMSENAVTGALRYMGFESGGGPTAHGFRATSSSLLNEQGWPADVIERQLAHIERNVRAAYNRSEYLTERHKMMQHWGDYLETLVNGATIIPLRPAS